jgi:hypothetical protein
MSRNQKILLAFGAVGLLCLIAGAVAFWAVRRLGEQVRGSIKSDPTSIAQVGAGIAAFEIPAGYEEKMAMSLFNYDMVMIAPQAPASQSMIITMMQIKGSLAANPEQMQQQIRQQSGRQYGQMKTVETREETIRGEKVLVTISESTLQEGPVFRQWMTIFKGNLGPTMLMIQGPAEDWDDNLIKVFIASIR